MSLTYCPRVVGPRRPDYHCLESILASPQFAGKTGEELALAIYNHLTSRADGTYHFWPSGETEGNPRIRRSVHDPVKLLNAYGWAICGQCAQVLYGIYRAGGLRPGLIGVPGHSLCEVFYDGRWHILDVDMWTWFRAAEGHIAGAAELAEKPRELILENPGRSNPCNLPDRKLESYSEMYAKTEVVNGRVEGVCPDWGIRAHCMDFHLRPGETLIRSTEGQGRFHVPQAWLQMKEKFGREWKGFPRERFKPFRSVGNGRWIYAPDLRAGPGDFQAGVWEATDLAQDDSGLLGPGSATWRILSPYPFCGKPALSGERMAHCDGVWLALAGSGPVRAEITDPEGNWVEVLSAEGNFDRQADVTELLTSRYGCLIRLTLGEGAGLAKLRFEGFILTAPMSLPRLEAGDNPMELRTGDKYGLCTVPWSRLMDFRAGADLPSQWVRAENAVAAQYMEGWQQVAAAGDGPVRISVRFDAPAGEGFAWAYVHASCREGPSDQPRGEAKLEWSRDGKTWRELSKIEIPNTPRQWDGAIDGEVRFDQAPGSVPSVHVRITSETPVTGLEFHGHLLGQPTAGQTLRIVHRWREGGGERSFEPPPGARQYVIHCDGEPEGHTIEMHAPSMARSRAGQ